MKFFFHFLSGFSCFDISYHTVKISEERFRVIINIAFLFCINSQIISFLHGRFIQIGSFTVKILQLEFHHNFGNVFINFFNKWSDSFGFRVKFIETSKMSDKFNELIMNLSLILRFFLLFGYLSVENSEKLWFKKHLMEGNEYFENEFENLWECVLKSNSIGNGRLISNEFIPVKFYKITELFVDYFEFLSDKLLKEENISVLVYIIKSINIWSDGSSELPSVRWFKTFQTVRVWMNIL